MFALPKTVIDHSEGQRKGYLFAHARTNHGSIKFSFDDTKSFHFDKKMLGESLYLLVVPGGDSESWLKSDIISTGRTNF